MNQLIHDGPISIAEGKNRFARKWENQTPLWSEFVARLSDSRRTSETHEAFMHMPKGQQDRIKDVGGFVGGHLENCIPAGGKTERCDQNVLSRTILSLDADFATPEFPDIVRGKLNNAFCLHSTHKFDGNSSYRQRLIIPLAHPVTPDECRQLTGYIKGLIGKNFFDPSDERASQMMYWPSHSADVSPLFEVNDEEWLDPDTILVEKTAAKLKTQADPLMKKGPVGIFCRTYTVQEAIAQFLSEIYIQSETDSSRYTYAAGSTANGLVVYDDKFAYSNHATDPAGHQCRNAFDLVRIHKFGSLDEGTGKTGAAAPSYKAMCGLVASDPNCIRTEQAERRNQTETDFSRTGGITLTPYTLIPKKKAEWLFYQYIPRGQVTALVSEGGIGKTAVAVHLASSVSTGKESMLPEFDFDDFFVRKPGNVIIFSAEDSASVVLKDRFEKNEADLSRIFTIDLSDSAFRLIKFDAPELESIIAEYRPDLVIFDPIQSFVRADVRMGERNAMRQALEPLIGYGEKYGTAFLIIVHTNKLVGAYGRRRMADSSDVWDLCRSVILMGKTGDGKLYFSHEKSNYGPLQDTVLFTLENGVPVFQGTTQMHDREFVLSEQCESRAKPQRENAKQVILNYLADNQSMTRTNLEESVLSVGISKASFRRALTELYQEKTIRSEQSGFGEYKRSRIILTHNSK